MTNKAENRVTFVATEEVASLLSDVASGNRSRYINQVLAERKNLLSQLYVLRRRIAELEKLLRSAKHCARCESRGSFVGKVFAKDDAGKAVVISTLVYCNCGAGAHAAQEALDTHVLSSLGVPSPVSAVGICES